MTQDAPPRRPVVGSREGFALATNIDRRQCKRVVPMKVLAFGLSRTGTSSLRQALLDLGYHDVYHYATPLNENPRDAEMWIDALRAKYDGIGKPFGREEWDQLLGHCMAVTDTPCRIFSRELLEAYPDAKVILTIRDSPRQWWDSQMNTIVRFAVTMFGKTSTRAFGPSSLWRMLCSYFAPKPPPQKMFEEIFRTDPCYTALMRDSEHGTREAEDYYVKHIEEIKRLVPKERLLVMNVKEGWEPLCRFLRKDVPTWAFPKANSSEEFLANGRAMGETAASETRRNMIQTLLPVGIALAAGLAWRWRRV